VGCSSKSPWRFSKSPTQDRQFCRSSHRGGRLRSHVCWGDGQFPYLDVPHFTSAPSPVIAAPTAPLPLSLPPHPVGYQSMRWSTLVLSVTLFYSLSFVNAIPHDVYEKRHWLHRRQDLTGTPSPTPVVPTPPGVEDPQGDPTPSVSPADPPPQNTPRPSSQSSLTPTPRPPTATSQPPPNPSSSIIPAISSSILPSQSPSST